ncbi:MAG: hypothetical protein ACE5G2_10815, partial [Candidatus Krumholzibacteriia bacterium]
MPPTPPKKRSSKRQSSKRGPRQPDPSKQTSPEPGPSEQEAPQPRFPNQVAKVVAVLVVLGGLVWLVLRERHFSGWVDDDAFISFRYARNLADGHGLVFNTGERVEGYTNFLWTVILSLAYRLGADIPNTARVLGVVFSVLTLPVVWLFSRTSLTRPPGSLPPGVRPYVLALAPLLLCLSESWAAWAVGGLENVFSAFLVVVSLLGYVSHLDSGKRSTLLLSALGFTLAGMNHPTNLLFTAVVGLHLVLRVARKRAERGHLLAFCIVFLAVFGGYTAWRIGFYGDLLPNTYYAKVGLTRDVILRGLRYFADILKSFPVSYASALVLGALLAMRRAYDHRAWLLLVPVILYSVYVVSVGGEAFPAYRSMVVLIPLFALVLQILVHEALRIPSGRLSPKSSVAVVTAVVVTVVANSLPLHASERVRRLDEAVRLGRTGLSTTAALMLKELLPKETLFAHSGAGLIAYYTGFRWIDTLGLTDHHIARTHVDVMGKGAAGHEKGDGAYVWARKPDYVMFPGYPISDRMPGTKTGRELFAIPEFHQTYRPIRLSFRYRSPVDDVPRLFGAGTRDQLA